MLGPSPMHIKYVYWTMCRGNKCKSRVNIDKMEQDYKPNIYLFMYVRTCVCMHECLYVCTYIRKKKWCANRNMKFHLDMKITLYLHCIFMGILLLLILPEQCLTLQNKSFFSSGGSQLESGYRHVKKRTVT